MRRPPNVAGLSVLLLLLVLVGPAPRAQAATVPGAHARWASSGSKPPSQGYIYKVKPNDTLWGIAAAHRISPADLIAANSLTNPRMLHAGQDLFVPAQPPTVQVDAAPASSLGSVPPGLSPDASTLLSLINEKRAATGIAPLLWSPELAQAAQSHADDCAQRNQGSHVGSDGAALETRLARVGTTPRWASENWANAQGVKHAFALWWNETPGRDPHRRNILDPRYQRIGVGIARGPWGTYFVADFASP